jgi:hypothetical protein
MVSLNGNGINNNYHPTLMECREEDDDDDEDEDTDTEKEKETTIFLGRRPQRVRNSISSTSDSSNTQLVMGDETTSQISSPAILRKKSILISNGKPQQQHQSNVKPVKHFSFNGIPGADEGSRGVRKSTKLRNTNSLAVPTTTVRQ